MKTKQQRIDLLMKFMRGEVPASALKDHVLTWLHLLSPEQIEKIEAPVGKVRPANCSVYHPDEPLRAIWDRDIPIGFTATYYLSMFAHPESQVKFIDCSNRDSFNTFLKSLPQKQLTDDVSTPKRGIN